MAFDTHILADRALLRKATGGILFIGMLIVLTGCAVDDVCVISYASSAEVKPPEAPPSGGALKSSPFPWDIVLSGISDLFSGARKKAIEEKVGYREHRSFALLRLRRAEDSRGGCQKKPRLSRGWTRTLSPDPYCLPPGQKAGRGEGVGRQGPGDGKSRPQSGDIDNAMGGETQR